MSKEFILMKKTIAVVPGDGIGPEVMQEAVKVLDAVAEKFGHQFDLVYALAGGSAYEKFGSHLPDETLSICEKGDAILFGSVGGPVSEMQLPKWKDCERNSILTLRKHFSFAVNLRPSRVYPQLQSLSPLKPELVAKGIDLLIVRELVGDAYFGVHKKDVADGERYATDEAKYTESQVKVAVHAAFECARKRRGKLTSVDKANVLTTSKLWREVAEEVAAEYPDVEYENMLVDNCAMQLIRDPSQFDVIVTSNMFGDILSDAAAVLPGSLGLAASASLNKDNFGLYEPPGGSAQDIAGQGVANPIAQILSAAMLLKYSFGLEAESKAIEDAVEASLEEGYRTGEIYSGEAFEKRVNTKQMTEAILRNLEKASVSVCNEKVSVPK